jgi:hypothetical protein
VVNATLTVNTVGSAVALAPRQSWRLSEGIGGLTLSCLLVFMVPRRRIWTALVLLVLTAGAFGVTGCGGSGQSSSSATTGTTGTPAGQYTVTVTASSGTISATTQALVIVQ